MFRCSQQRFFVIPSLWLYTITNFRQLANYSEDFFTKYFFRAKQRPGWSWRSPRTRLLIWGDLRKTSGASSTTSSSPAHIVAQYWYWSSMRWYWYWYYQQLGNIDINIIFNEQTGIVLEKKKMEIFKEKVDKFIW